MIHKLIGPTDPNHGGRHAQIGDFLQDATSKASLDDVILKSHDHIRTLPEKLQQGGIDRLGKPRINHSRLDSLLFFQVIRKLHRHRQHLAVRPDHNLLSMPNHLCFSDRQGHRSFLDRRIGPHSSGISNGHRSCMQTCRIEHVHKLILVLRRHVNQVWNTPQIGNIEESVVRRTVIP